MTMELLALALSILRYERRRREYPLVIDGRCVDAQKSAPPPIVNLSDDRPVWLRRDRRRE